MYRFSGFPSLLVFLTALTLAGCGNGGQMPELRQGGGTALEQTSAQEPIDLYTFGHAYGSADAPVVVVEFSDFGCPYCARFALETLPEIEREFIATGQVRWQYVPFVMGTFPNGEGAARSAECAAEQNEFWPMHDLLYERQREWRASGDAELLFQGYAEDLELDVASFASCFSSERVTQRIARSNAVTMQLGVRATPSFLINEQPVQGALPLEEFRRVLQWSGAVSPENPDGQ